MAALAAEASEWKGMARLELAAGTAQVCIDVNSNSVEIASAQAYRARRARQSVLPDEQPLTAGSEASP